jgi:4-amino-4-deoxy-L-arabinose transferase-like glycosyltransferase
MKQFHKLFPWFVAVGIALNANGLFIDILEPDGALYATIAKRIALTGDWINLWAEGHDWLDKPHLPFWLSAISFKIFGINAFAYKLPGFICWLLSGWYTYKIAAAFCDKYTARFAVVIYIFSLHAILNNFDVRAEPFLTAFSIAAIYYLYKAQLTGKLFPLVLASLMAAFSVMTKGIFVLITIGSGFIIYWIVSGEWKQFVNYRWYLFVILVLLFITPELYCLYQQFDLHPEKVVFGKTNVSGIRFFFWDSQFGRFFNTGPITGSGEPTFFLHTTLWAFLPWSILFYIAVFQLLRKAGNSDINDKKRWIIYGSALITFLLFSFSGFQLPHYISILFPQFAIITAAYLTKVTSNRAFNRIRNWQYFLIATAVLAVCLLSYYSKIGYSLLVPAFALVIAIAAIFFTGDKLAKVVTVGAAFSVILFSFLFNFFYPQLLKYQAGMMAGKFLKEKKLPLKAYILKPVFYTYSYEFYAPGFVERIENFDNLQEILTSQNTGAFYTSENTLLELKQNGFSFDVLQKFSYYQISMLKGEFLDPSTRPAQLETMCLIRIHSR